ncbi:hypothetical protein M0802_004565 [Mischocyttarus mexicanus]|nr:hypothetical protein M0802_004565 [Mischocyttarus mexicanus]
MSKIRDKVIMCRGFPISKEDSYLSAFKEINCQCDYLFTSKFEFVNSSDLKKCLETPDNYHGLILTSQRVVDAIYRLILERGLSLKQWQKLPTYCVGTTTKSFAETRLGLEHCLGSESGNAKELAELIVSNVEKITKPLLYPCSEIAHETIEQILLQNNIDVQRLVVYQNVIMKLLEQEFLNIVRDNIPKIFVFFSSSSVDYIVSVLKKHPDKMKFIKAVAIGPTTEKSLINANFKIYATAAKPTSTALIEAIENAACDNNS